MLATSWASAEAPIVGGRTPRSIGRAGTGTASDDGAGALLVNPAAIARRDAARMQLGVAFLDDELYYLSSATAPAARDQSSSRLVPIVGIEGAVGKWLLGAAFITSARSERQFRRPARIPANELGNAFEYRYAGLGGSLRRDTFVAGVARRVTDGVAIGLSAGASRVALTESRRLWAGNTSRIDRTTMQPERAGDPAQDVEVAFAAADLVAPTATLGVLVAPGDSRIELAASVNWSAPARVEGEVGAAAVPQMGNMTAPIQPHVASDASARLELHQPIALRTGARWLGERWSVEVGGDLWIMPRGSAAPRWQIEGVRITDSTTLGTPREVTLAELPSRVSARTHGAIRGALDVELIPGFLWATGGYAFTSGGTARSRLSPTFGDLGGHTMALGLEANAGGFAITLGWARTWSIKEPEPVSRWRLDNPFGSGDAMVPPGTYDGSTDMIGLSLDAELYAPD
jgi:hypothetical protein